MNNKRDQNQRIKSTPSRPSPVIFLRLQSRIVCSVFSLRTFFFWKLTLPAHLCGSLCKAYIHTQNLYADKRKYHDLSVHRVKFRKFLSMVLPNSVPSFYNKYFVKPFYHLEMKFTDNIIYLHT